MWPKCLAVPSQPLEKLLEFRDSHTGYHLYTTLCFLSDVFRDQGKKLGFPPSNVFLEEIHSRRGRPKLKFQETWDINCSSYIACIQPTKSISTHTDARATYAHPVTKKYTGCPMRAETGLHLIAETRTLACPLQSMITLFFYATVNSHK